MVIKRGFCTELCSDLEFEGMVIDISYDMQNIASINYDKGIENMEIEILSRDEGALKLIFPLDDFLNILEKAKQLAIRCAKEDELRDQ